MLGEVNMKSIASLTLFYVLKLVHGDRSCYEASTYSCCYDTEIDEEYLNRLAPKMSHSYRLVYDSKTASTHVIKGYFWRQKMFGLKDAS